MINLCGKLSYRTNNLSNRNWSPPFQFLNKSFSAVSSPAKQRIATSRLRYPWQVPCWAHSFLLRFIMAGLKFRLMRLKHSDDFYLFIYLFIIISFHCLWYCKADRRVSTIASETKTVSCCLIKPSVWGIILSIFLRLCCRITWTVRHYSSGACDALNSELSVHLN